MSPRSLLPAAALAAALHLSACGGEAASAPAGPTGLTDVATAMAGHYSSAAQAAADSAFFDIRLHMVPIWPGAADTVWLYVEQAAAGYLDRPYRQRVYRLTAEEGPSGERYRSAVFTLPDPPRWAGAWRTPAAFDTLAPAALEERAGCDIVLERAADGTWTGSTGDRTCPSNLRGAAWATSEVTLGPERLVSWDRGWDSTGVQVWGAETGGYVFDRVTAEQAAREPGE